jgi:hypothetical protein
MPAKDFSFHHFITFAKTGLNVIVCHFVVDNGILRSVPGMACEFDGVSKT